jgi:hypothetical protein
MQSMLCFEFEFCDLRFICNLEFEIWNLCEIMEKKELLHQSEFCKLDKGYDNRTVSTAKAEDRGA